MKPEDVPPELNELGVPCHLCGEPAKGWAFTYCEGRVMRLCGEPALIEHEGRVIRLCHDGPSSCYVEWCVFGSELMEWVRS